MVFRDYIIIFHLHFPTCLVCITHSFLLLNWEADVKLDQMRYPTLFNKTKGAKDLISSSKLILIERVVFY